MKRKAQTFLEYSILAAAVIAAVITMGIYLRRAVMGRVKDNAERVGGGFFFDPGKNPPVKTTRTIKEREQDMIDRSPWSTGDVILHTKDGAEELRKTGTGN